jgi:branched-chain amino acid transport system permease protein
MRDLVTIAAFAIAVAVLSSVLRSGVWTTFLMMALYAALLAQAWNLLGGYGGQFSFGHALFFGTGAYVQVLAQTQAGLNAWIALACAWRAPPWSAPGRCAELSLRSAGLVLRARDARLRRGLPILAVTVGFTGGGVG